MTAALLASLLVRPFFDLRGVSVTLSAPERVVVGEPVQFTIQVRNDGTGRWSALRLQRPLLPWDGRWIGGRPSVEDIGPGETRSVRVTVSFAARGLHHLDAFHVATLIPGALAQGGRVTVPGPRFLVVPRIAAIEGWTTPGRDEREVLGNNPADQAGESMELLGVRPYRPGDRLRDLHALTWSRIGEPIVREFQREQQERLGIVVDPTESKRDSAELEALVSLAAGVIHSASRHAGQADLWIVGDSPEYRPLGFGRGRPEAGIDVLASVDAGHDPLDPEATLAQLGPGAARLSGVCFLTTKWGEPQARIVSALRAGRVPVQVLRVGRSTGKGETWEEPILDPARILSGDPIHLPGAFR